jgi:hypothetical protein
MIHGVSASPFSWKDQSAWMAIQTEKSGSTRDWSHDMDSNTFWSDLTRSHYANWTTVQDLNIHLLRQDYLPNLRKCRPIENFRFILKAGAYQCGWKAENIAQLR